MECRRSARPVAKGPSGLNIHELCSNFLIWAKNYPGWSIYRPGHWVLQVLRCWSPFCCPCWTDEDKAELGAPRPPRQVSALPCPHAQQPGEVPTSGNNSCPPRGTSPARAERCGLTTQPPAHGEANAGRKPVTARGKPVLNGFLLN